ncbi:MAG: methyltransferase domain-containing protein [Chloroherpetonaceae bacterium]|nr:methyltransferase domain-containing protein [Chloroherpetonaceae bacterium]
MTINQEKETEKKWFQTWFESPYYLKLYGHRDTNEAQQTVRLILTCLEELRGKGAEKPKLLDVACGAGRHAVQFAKEGLSITANDLSEFLLTEARRLSIEHSAKLRFTQNDMRRLPFRDEFDAAVQLFTSFGYFEDPLDDERTLISVSRSLKQKGIYVLDYLNPAVLRSKLTPKNEKLIDGVRYVETRYIQGDQVVKHIDIYDKDMIHNFTESVRLYEPYDLKMLITSSGFQVRKLLGDYEGNPFNESSSPRLIIFAQKV